MKPEHQRAINDAVKSIKKGPAAFLTINSKDQEIQEILSEFVYGNYPTCQNPLPEDLELTDRERKEIQETYRNWLVVFVDAADPAYCDEKAQKQELDRLKACIDSTYEKILVVVNVDGSMVPVLEHEYRYAEEEYSLYLKQCPAATREHFEYEAEQLFLNAQAEEQTVCVLRVENLCGRSKLNKHELLFAEMIHQLRTEHKIDVKYGQKKIALTGIRNLLTAIVTVLNVGRPQKIYQLVGIVTQMGRMGYEIYDRFSMMDQTENDVNVTSENTAHESVLQDLSFKSLGWKDSSSVLRRIRELIDPLYAYDFTDVDMESLLYGAYGGKLEMIKKIEMEMLKEIDRICKKYEIRYFLVGGSLLGAVRHKGFIPWDDDLDIGMMRDDYEKFRKVAPGELNEKYAYQSYLNEPDSHYIFDKVRLKDTWFSTKFSNKFDIENGLFIDILVYDKTSNSPAMQNWHIKWLLFWTQMINMVWSGLKKAHFGYRVFKHIQWLVKIPSLNWYHKRLEHCLKKYDRNPKCVYLLDGVGQNIRKGAFPASWFDELLMVPFEDMILPIPAGYDEYLRHWYGDSYMELLPLEKRFSGHVMARIDLGDYLYEGDSEENN